MKPLDFIMKQLSSKLGLKILARIHFKSQMMYEKNQFNHMKVSRSK